MSVLTQEELLTNLELARLLQLNYGTDDINYRHYDNIAPTDNITFEPNRFIGIIGDQWRAITSWQLIIETEVDDKPAVSSRSYQTTVTTELLMFLLIIF